MFDVACALIVDSNERLFAAQRSSTMSLPSKWELPGGKVEIDESPEDCLVREISEELDLSIVIINALTPHSHRYPSFSIRLIPFICKQNGGEITLKEHSDFRWLRTDELLDLDWADADVPILKQYLTYLDAIKSRNL